MMATIEKIETKNCSGDYHVGFQSKYGCVYPFYKNPPLIHSFCVVCGWSKTSINPEWKKETASGND
jgi:hypothetical protein